MPAVNYDPRNDPNTLNALAAGGPTAVPPPASSTGTPPIHATDITGGPAGGPHVGDVGTYQTFDTSTLPQAINFHFGDVPKFTPPEFHVPTAAEATNDPGYQFRLNQGEQALQQSAAARGLLRTGGTLKDLLEYGQNFATQTYTDVFNRALSAYDRQYQGAKDVFAPQMAQYQLTGEAQKEAALEEFRQKYDIWKFLHTPPPAPAAPVA